MAMAAEVSRTLATFIASLGLGRDAARILAEQYADVQDVADLPDWVTEDADDRQQRARRDDREALVTRAAEILRRFNPAQPRDPGGENGGRWIKSPAALAVEAFEDLYSAIVDEADAGDLRVSVHENGDFVLSSIDDNGHYTVLFDDLNPDKARSIADDLEWATSEDIPDDAANDPKTHLVDWQHSEDDIVIGYDVAGDVSLRVPRNNGADPGNLEDYLVTDLSVEDAAGLADALRDMADSHEALPTTRSRRLPSRRVRRAGRSRRLSQRRFNPAQPRDPGGDHGGEWVKGPASAAKAVAKTLGKMSEDDFFAAHGEDWHDQYGPTSEFGAILWKNGEASLYRDLGKGKVHAFGDVDSHAARRLSADLKWAVGQPDEGDPGGGKLAGHRQVDLGHITAEVGYGYNSDGELFVRVTMPPVGKDKKPTPIDLEDLDQVEQLVEDLGKLADDLDNKAYAGPGR